MYYDFIKYENDQLNEGLNYDTIERDDLLILKIFYSSLNYMSYKESPSISIFGLISNLGGTLGLFLGKYC